MSQQPPQQPPYAGPYQPYPLAGPAPVSPQDERTWATLAHLSPFAGGIVGLPVLGPLVVYLIYKDRSPFVRRHAAAALNFQLTLLIASLIGLLLMVLVTVLTLGIGLLVVVPIAMVVVVPVMIAAVVLQIVAAVAANHGQDYQYPLTPRMVS